MRNIFLIMASFLLCGSALYSCGVPGGEGISATRNFAGPDQYPPTSFAAYGIVAFPSKATPEDQSRYAMICDAYVASFPSVSEAGMPAQDQMVTVWPIDDDVIATAINQPTTENVCDFAVKHYGLDIALHAIDDAERAAGKPLDDIGPYLLAWSPSIAKGNPSAIVLQSDLSTVVTPLQAKTLFMHWRREIVENPGLWRAGWDMVGIKLTLRRWADAYGPAALRIFGKSEGSDAPISR